MHVNDLKINNGQVFCLFFVFVFSFLVKMLMAFFQTPSSIYLLAFLLFSFSAVWVVCFCVLHRRVPAPLCFYMVWIPRRIWLRPFGAAVS